MHRPAAKPLETTSSSTKSSAALRFAAAVPEGGMRVVKGFLPLLIYSLFFFAAPIVDEYTDMDYTTVRVKAGVVVASVLAPLVLVLSNDCVVWFNSALFFHIGIEVGLLHELYDHARDDTLRDVEAALAWVGFAVIIAHLLPFLLLDHAKVLIPLAFVGVVANTTTALYLDVDKMLLVAFSASVLLGATLLIASIDCVRTSVLSQLRIALTRGTCANCAAYE